MTSIYENFRNYLHNFFTFNGKCAHYIEEPRYNLIKNHNLTTIILVFNSDEIEYKINKEKLDYLTNKYFFQINNIRDKITSNIIENIGTNSNKTNITININQYNNTELVNIIMSDDDYDENIVISGDEEEIIVIDSDEEEIIDDSVVVEDEKNKFKNYFFC